MPVQRYLLYVCVLLTAVTATRCQHALAAEAERPNILFIFTDDQPQSCMGCMGNEHIQTPNMDRLASESLLFTNAFVTTAICCSNRACILAQRLVLRTRLQYETSSTADC